MRLPNGKQELRVSYYDVFSRFYDAFVAFHSRDSGARLRENLAECTGIASGERVLDICTGTGSLLRYLQARVGSKGGVYAVDFSRGMLKQAKRKYEADSNVFLIQANVTHLPFKAKLFDAVTCSHAFYELVGETVDRCLREVARVLEEEGSFVIMEHDAPRNFFLRVLFWIRIFSMGRRRALQTLREEEKLLLDYFRSVEAISTETGRSKIFVLRAARDVARCNPRRSIASLRAPQ